MLQMVPMQKALRVSTEPEQKGGDPSMTSEPAGQSEENTYWLEAAEATLTANGHKQVVGDKRKKDQGGELEGEGVSASEKAVSADA